KSPRLRIPLVWTTPRAFGFRWFGPPWTPTTGWSASLSIFVDVLWRRERGDFGLQAIRGYPRRFSQRFHFVATGVNWRWHCRIKMEYSEVRRIGKTDPQSALPARGIARPVRSHGNWL